MFSEDCRSQHGLGHGNYLISFQCYSVAVLRALYLYECETMADPDP
jgi:hypothetical protein